MNAKCKARLARWSVYAGAAFTIIVLASIVGYILFKGIPNLTPQLFAWKYNTENVSLMPALINTLLMTALSLLIAVPLGIGAAIYLTEYARRGNRLVKLVRITAETLSGIPSIIYGLFGSLFFVVALKIGLSLLSGALTLAIMILPLIMRTTEEALLAVPDDYREGSFGLGAGRLRTTFKVVLPSAISGILSGVILGIGRIVGETAALIYTAGTVPEVATSLFDSTRTLSVHMYAISSEGLYIDQSYATAVVLLVIVAGINALSACVAKQIGRKNHGEV
ncbi:MAG: phosphate ABC transporter permease PstA [Eubacteriales bacterium]|nr:phosphate ABC transporter permease PstA [Eubacteriales bacterium]